MRRLTLTLLLIAAGLGTARAAESKFTVVGGLDLGFKDLRLDIGSLGNVFSPTFVTVNPNIGLGYKSLYTSLSYDKSVSADPGIGLDPSGTGTMTDYSRADSTFTLGYRLNESFNLFAGYTKGVNKFAGTSAAIFLIAADVKYTESGPFAGVAYSKTFSDKGTLGLSIAYAQLDGELKRTDYPNIGRNFDVKGDVTGLSYGVTWSGPLTGSLGYRVGLKATEYKMKDPGDISERYTSFFIGIMNYF